jgi:acetyltransferase-like isoleucine patch superfamily enzyme
MRTITPSQIAVFLALLGLALGLAVATTALLVAPLPLGSFRGVVLTVSAVILLYLWSFGLYRAFLRVLPLGSGELAPGSREEFAAQVNILFYLMLFNSLIRTHFLPVPLVRLVYLALGARLGPNTYSAGALLDPPLISIGANSIVGHDAVVFAHAIEGARFALEPVVMGDNVTVGAKAVIMSGVTVGDGAIVSAGAVVRKGTRIGPGEVWGGVPARRLRDAEPDTPA